MMLVFLNGILQVAHKDYEVRQMEYSPRFKKLDYFDIVQVVDLEVNRRQLYEKEDLFMIALEVKNVQNPTEKNI